MAPKPRTWPFFALAFLFTWGLQIPGLLAQGEGSAHPGYIAVAALGIFGPFVASMVVAGREGGWGGIRALLRPVLAWQTRPQNYVLALAPALLLSIFLFGLNAAGRGGPLSYSPGWGGLVLGLVISIEEEIGWRGFALPRLMAQFGSFGSSVILGAIWYVWHLPMLVGMGVPLSLVLVMLLYFCGASLFLTALYERTGGSLLIVSLGHLAAHLNNSHRALPQETTPLVAHALIYAGLGMLFARPLSRSFTAPRLCVPPRAADPD